MARLFSLYGEVLLDNKDTNKKIDETTEKAKKADKETSGSFAKLGGALKKGATVIGGAVTAVGGALIATVESSREHRAEMTKLTTAYQSAGHSSKVAKATFGDLNAVLGDSGQAVEAANHLALLCDNEKDLQKWTDICTGVYATFGDSLPIEGLTEAANETAKTGAVTGSLADALNWAGVSEDDFNKKLEKCNSESERQSLIQTTLNGLYDEAAGKYKKNSKELMEANRAQQSWNDSLAKIGKAVEPMLNTLKSTGANLLTQMAPLIVNIAKTLMPMLGQLVENIFPILVTLIEQLMPPIMEIVEMLMPILMDILSAVMPIITEIISVLLPPLLNLLKPILGLLRPIFALLEPFLQIFGALAKPLAKLIDKALVPMLDLLEKFANMLSKVLAPVVRIVAGAISNQLKGLFDSIKKIVKNITGIFEGFIDFIAGVFTGNWEKAFGGIVKIFKNIWEGIVEIFKVPINWIIDGLNGFIKGINGIRIPDWVPLVGGKSFSIPQIKRLRIGLDYVPYDDYPALLHKGERVLTARENESYGSGTGRNVNIVINNPRFNDDSEVDRIMSRVADKLALAGV